MRSGWRFQGTGRFQLVAPIGAGGMGVVYEVVDLEHRSNVALKLLPTLSPPAVARFKQEFRSLRGIHHPNLVTLGELIEDQGQLFFTMELVRGVDIIAHTHGAKVSHRATRGTAGADDPTLRGVDALGAGWQAGSGPPTQPDEPRLRSAFAQLTHALMTLHAHQKVHRDVKPSNVLVTDDGRVVLLDFGLIADLASGSTAFDIGITGTLAYMSPEQAALEPPSAASDWYSLGALLHEALTGSPPIVGPPAHVLERKRTSDPKPPHSPGWQIPDDLSDLCHRLLARDPGKRPTGEGVLAVLAPDTPVDVIAPSSGNIATVPSSIVGRVAELQRLHRAFARVTSGPLLVVMEGESGVGKTALVREFLGQLEQEARPVLVFRGRCSEREMVPFQAVDAVIEQIADHLRQLQSGGGKWSGDEPYARAAAEASRAFPVLSQVVLPASDRRLGIGDDPVAKRHLGFRGIHDLLAELSRASPVVVAIDDWQWADADSVALLSAVLAPPGGPRLLLLLVQRSGLRPLRLPTTPERIEVGNLLASDAQELTVRLIADAGATVDDASVRAIAAESTGHPLFIAELVRQLLERGSTEKSPPRLDDALYSRYDAQDPVLRRAVDLLAVARAPVPLSLLCDAMAHAGRRPSWAELTALMARLRKEHFVRADGLGGADLVDFFHDRVAEAVLARLPAPDRKLCYESLAVVFEQSGSSDFEALSAYWQGAGDPARAASYAMKAADRAMDGLAFERAAQLYRACRELWSAGVDATVHESLGAALSHLGRGREAADAYLAAASLAQGDRQLEMSRLAADQLFRSGYIDDAIALIERVFDTLKLPLPKSPRQSLTGLVFRRAQIRLRGIEFRKTSAHSIDPRVLSRIDACWSLAVGLSTVDNLRGAYLQSRHMLLALEVGEPFRVLRALATEAGFQATRGIVANPRVDHLLSTADALVHSLNDPYAFGFVHLARAIGMFLRADFRAARGAAEAAESIFERRPIMASWELASARMFLLWSCFYRGDLGALHRRVPELIREAEGRGDLYAATCLRLTVCNVAWLVKDDIEEAKRQLNEADERWSHEGVHLQHYWSTVAWVQSALYEGDGKAAHARLIHIEPLLQRALVLRIEHARIELRWLQARTAVLRAQLEPDKRSAFLRDAARFARMLQREEPAWATTVSQLVTAGIHRLRGEDQAAKAGLMSAAVQAGRQGLGIAALAANWCLRHTYGETGAGRALDEDMVVRPDRWARTIAPGLCGPVN